MDVACDGIAAMEAEKVPAGGGGAWIECDGIATMAAGRVLGIRKGGGKAWPPPATEWLPCTALLQLTSSISNDFTGGKANNDEQTRPGSECKLCVMSNCRDGGWLGLWLRLATLQIHPCNIAKLVLSLSGEGFKQHSKIFVRHRHSTPALAARTKRAMHGGVPVGVRHIVIL